MQIQVKMHFICIYNILPDNISLDYSFINRIFPKLLGLNVDNKSRQDFLMDTNLTQTNKINQLIFKNLYEPSSGSKKKKKRETAIVRQVQRLRGTLRDRERIGGVPANANKQTIIVNERERDKNSVSRGDRMLNADVSNRVLAGSFPSESIRAATGGRLLR